jgi:hypothetical protein
MIARSSGDAQAVHIGPARMARANQPLTGMRIAVGRSDLVRDVEPGWLPLTDVPPGRYEVRIRSPRPAGRSMEVRLGTGTAAYRLWQLDARLDQRHPLWLPAGADRLVFAPDTALSGTHPLVELVPVDVARDAARAVDWRSYAAADVFFLSEGTFVENDGFWVPGGGSASLLVVPKADTPEGRLALELSNGPVTNAVRLGTGQAATEFLLEPGTRQVVPLPAVGAGGLIVHVTSAAGFRPAEHDTASTDRRVLGVRGQVSR